MVKYRKFPDNLFAGPDASLQIMKSKIALAGILLK